MPIIDGYDDLDLGPKRFPEGEHTGTIETAKLTTGTNKNGGSYIALDVQLTDGTHGENIRVFLPKTNSEWVGWEDWQRKRLKRQLNGLGIHISEVESDQARAKLIGKTQAILVTKKQNGEGTNVYFREDEEAASSGSSLPEPEQTTGESSVVQPAAALVV